MRSYLEQEANAGGFTVFNSKSPLRTKKKEKKDTHGC